MRRGTDGPEIAQASWRCGYTAPLCARLVARAIGYELAAARIRRSSGRRELHEIADALQNEAAQLRQDAVDFSPYPRPRLRRHRPLRPLS